MLGSVSPFATLAGGVAVAAAVCWLLVPAFPLAEVDGRRLGSVNVFDWVVLLPLVVVVAAAAAACLLGLPRFGQATLLAAGSAATGLLARTGYLLDASGRSSQELPLGVGTSVRYQPGAGLWLLAVANALLVVAFVLAALGWSRTVMDDDGSFDGLRPRFATVGLVVGLAGALAVGMSPVASSIAGLAPPALLQRAGLNLVGGLLLAAAVAGWGAVAATLRPRLATVGALAGVAAVLATEGLGAALLTIRSPALRMAGGAVGELLAAAAFALLALAAWRLSHPLADSDEDRGLVPR